jgi:hypothetical protein
MSLVIAARLVYRPGVYESVGLCTSAQAAHQAKLEEELPKEEESKLMVGHSLVSMR